MRYIVQSDEGHRAEIVPGSRKGQGSVEHVHIDLSRASLFSAPSKDDPLVREPQLLHPLKERCESAFKQLDGIPLEDRYRSPVTAALFYFRQKHLPELLKLLDTPYSPDTGAHERLTRLQAHPQRQAKILRKIVQAIDKELPDYFRPEKEIGTFEQLTTDFTKPNPFLIEERPSRKIRRRDPVMVDTTGRQLLYDWKRNTSYTDRALPTSGSVLDSLCKSGTLGEDLLGLNQATLVGTSMISQLQRIPPEVREEMERGLRRSIWESDSLSDERKHYRSACWRQLLGTIGLGVGSASLALALVDGSLGLFESMLFVPTAAFLLTCKKAISYRDTVKEWLSTMARELLDLYQQEVLESQLPYAPTGVKVMPNTLISHLVQISGGGARVLLGTGTQEWWKGEIPSMRRIDFSALRHTPVDDDPDKVQPRLTIAAYAQRDGTGRKLSRITVYQIGTEPLLYAANVERAAHTWNVAHAMEVLRSFCEHHEVDVPKALWLNHVDILKASSFDSANESGVFPDLQRRFANLTRHLKINNDLWDTVALPLHAAHTLHRIHQTHRAQQIACEIVKREVRA